MVDYKRPAPYSPEENLELFWGHAGKRGVNPPETNRIFPNYAGFPLTQGFLGVVRGNWNMEDFYSGKVGV